MFVFVFVQVRAIKGISAHRFLSCAVCVCMCFVLMHVFIYIYMCLYECLSVHLNLLMHPCLCGKCLWVACNC